MSDYLSVDEAVAALSAPADEPTEQQAPADTGTDTASEAVELNTHTGQDSQSPDVDHEDAPDTASGDEVEEGEADDGAQDAPTIEAPQFLASEDKAAFAKLSPEAKQLFVKFEQQARTATSKQMETATNARKTADAEAQAFAKQKETLDQVLPIVAQQFASRYAGITSEQWEQWFSTDPQAATAGKLQLERDQKSLQQLIAAKQQADEQSLKQHWQVEGQRLEGLASTNATAKRLLDPVTRDQQFQRIVASLQADGYDDNSIKHMSAKDWLMAADAYAYRELQKSAPVQTQKTVGQQTPKAQSKGSASMKAPTSTTSQSTSQAKTAANRFAQTNSVKDAVALMQAQRQAQTNGRKTP